MIVKIIQLYNKHNYTNTVLHLYYMFLKQFLRIFIFGIKNLIIGNEF